MIEFFMFVAKSVPALAVVAYLVSQTNRNNLAIARDHNDAMDKMADKVGDNTAEVRVTKELINAGLACRYNGQDRQRIPPYTLGEEDAPRREILWLESQGIGAGSSHVVAHSIGGGGDSGSPADGEPTDPGTGDEER